LKVILAKVHTNKKNVNAVLPNYLWSCCNVFYRIFYFILCEKNKKHKINKNKYYINKLEN